MGLLNKITGKEKTEETGIEWLTFKEKDWARAREIILVDKRHVDLVKDTTKVDDTEQITFTVFMNLTREEAIDMYARLLAAGIKEFVDNSKDGKEGKDKK